MPDATPTGDSHATHPGVETISATAAPVTPPGYDLAEEVGRGGMGIVYRARDVALDREVAVKVLLDKYAPDSGTARRFVDEARITGQLQHPGIPAVYQVGKLPDGRPFLAMKLIKGDTLDARLKAGGPIDPLAVFEAVCQAVGYAHAHGVLHRDLKPANVMVGAFGEVQVMDWGLAKVLASSGVQPRRPGDDPEATAAQTAIKSLRDTDTPFTQYGSVLGTPAFMAPEQAAGELDKVGPRADVFGLGAVLCVLLTGQPPFVGEDAGSIQLNAIRGNTVEAFARLDGCGADPDVIALAKRCLAFDTADRPADGQAVAAEVAALRRAADDRARQAERDKLAAEVRAGEQRKRRQLLQWAAAAVAVVLAAGITVSLWQAKAAMREAFDAETARRTAGAARPDEAAQRANAEAKEAEANATVKFFEDKVFAAARPKWQDGGLGHDVTLRDAIAASLPTLAAGFADQPLVEARLRRTLGLTFMHLGDSTAAVVEYERARAIFTERSGPDHPDTLATMNGLAFAYQDQGRLAEALALYEQVLAARRRVLPPDDPETLRSMHNVAVNVANHNRPADALPLHEQVLAARRRVLPPDDPETLWSLHAVAVAHSALGRHADALRLHEEALAARRRVFTPDHPDTLWSLHGVALNTAALGRHDDALKLYWELLAARRRVLPPGHPATQYTMWEMAGELCHLDRGAEALPLIDECIAHSAAQKSYESVVWNVIVLRVRHFQKGGDPTGCRATAERWEQFNRTDRWSLYAAGCYRAVAAGLYAKANQPAEATADADRAMAWLTKAVAAGFRNRGHIEQDTDLDFLRTRADFQALVTPMPYLAPPPRPVR